MRNLSTVFAKLTQYDNVPAKRKTVYVNPMRVEWVMPDMQGSTNVTRIECTSTTLYVMETIEEIAKIVRKAEKVGTL